MRRGKWNAPLGVLPEEARVERLSFKFSGDALLQGGRIVCLSVDEGFSSVFV